MMEFLGVPLIILASVLCFLCMGSIKRLAISATWAVVMFWASIMVQSIGCESGVLGYSYCGELTGMLHIFFMAILVGMVSGITSGIIQYRTSKKEVPLCKFGHVKAIPYCVGCGHLAE